MVTVIELICYKKDMQKKLQLYSYSLPNLVCLASSKYYIMYTWTWASFFLFFYLKQTHVTCRHGTFFPPKESRKRDRLKKKEKKEKK